MKEGVLSLTNLPEDGDVIESSRKKKYKVVGSPVISHREDGGVTASFDAVKLIPIRSYYPSVLLKNGDRIRPFRKSVWGNAPITFHFPVWHKTLFSSFSPAKDEEEEKEFLSLFSLMGG